MKEAGTMAADSLRYSRLETADVETSSEAYDRRFSGGIGKYFLDIQEEVVLGLLRPSSKGKVLDIGGGHAQLAIPLSDHGFEVTVAGSDPVCARKLTAHLKERKIRFCVCDLLDLPFPDNAFDAVLAFRLLPHIRDWERLVAEMCRVAGRVIVADYPDIRSANIVYRMFFKAKKAMEVNTRPFRLFDRRIIADRFGRHGFGQPAFVPQFFIPMVIHRVLDCAKGSRLIENAFRKAGLTARFGSPIIFRVEREHS